MPLNKNQVVTLTKDIAVKALKGRTGYYLGAAGMTYTVIKPHETMAGYFHMRQLENTQDYPPMALLHFTEVTA